MHHWSLAVGEDAKIEDIGERNLGAIMWVMPLLGYLGTGLGLAFLVAAVASGLYYLSELVEEHSVLAKKTLSFLIYAVIGIQVILTLVDRLPVWRSGLSILSHLLYSLNLRRFPIVKLADPVFIASCSMYRSKSS